MSGKIVPIEFYEEKDTSGKPRLRFRETGLFAPQHSTAYDLFMRGVHIPAYQLSDGRFVEIAKGFVYLWHTDAVAEGVSFWQAFRYRT